jgi:hypothetical protein
VEKPGLISENISSMSLKYKHNSGHKDSIRIRWVHFIREMIKENENLNKNGIAVLTFPAEEMHDLQLFAGEGFIGWEKTETGHLSVTKGRIICFEKSQPIWKNLRTRFVNAIVENEFEKYLSNHFKAMLKGSMKIFPIDVINLDYDGAISKNSLPLEVIMNMIFELQAKHKKNFCLFMTWPKTHDPFKDEAELVTGLKETIDNNLHDPRAVLFKNRFEEKFKSVDDLEFEALSIIGITKKILSQAANKKYQIKKHEYYSYGENRRQPMMSVLYHFDYVGQHKTQSAIYSEDVLKSLSNVITYT